LLALAAIYDGGSRSDAAKIGGVGLQTVRDWLSTPWGHPAW
jgi:transposase